MLSPLPAQLPEQPRPAGTAATLPGPSRAPPARTAPICRGAPPEAGLRLEELRLPVVGTPREPGTTLTWESLSVRLVQKPQEKDDRGEAGHPSSDRASSPPAFPAAAVPLPPLRSPPHRSSGGSGGGPGSRSRGAARRSRRVAAGSGGRRAEGTPPQRPRPRRAAPLPRRGAQPGSPSFGLKAVLRRAWRFVFCCFFFFPPLSLFFKIPFQARLRTPRSPIGSG